MTDLSKLAAGLSKAQREAVLRMPLPFALETAMQGVVMLDTWTTAREAGVSVNTLQSLNGFGGVDPETFQCGPVIVTFDFCNDGKRQWKLTDTGLQLRAYLEQNP